MKCKSKRITNHFVYANDYVKELENLKSVVETCIRGKCKPWPCWAIRSSLAALEELK